MDKETEAMCKALKEAEKRVMKLIEKKAKELRKNPKVRKEIEESLGISYAA